MNTHVFLRIASVLAFVYCAGHMSGFPWTPSDAPEPAKVVHAMKLITFDAEGATRTYWDFYQGFGLIIGFFLLCQALLLWQISSTMKNDTVKVIPILTTLFISFIANAILSWKFFFTIPVVLAIAISAWIAVAILFSYRRSSSGKPGKLSQG